MKGTYYRWTRTRATKDCPEFLTADILGNDIDITVLPTGEVGVKVPNRPLNPDEARMIGVRIVEAAALAGHASEVKEP